MIALIYCGDLSIYENGELTLKQTVCKADSEHVFKTHWGFFRIADEYTAYKPSLFGTIFRFYDDGHATQEINGEIIDRP